MTTIRPAHRLRPFAFLLFASWATPCVAGSALAAERRPIVAERARPAGLTKRVPWTTSKVVGSPEPPYLYNVRRAWPELKFKQPVYMLPEPGTNRVWVQELEESRILAVDDNPASKQSEQIFLFPKLEHFKTSGYSFAFHPQFAKNRHVFFFMNLNEQRHRKPLVAPIPLKPGEVAGPEPKPEKKNVNSIERFVVSDKAPFHVLSETRTPIIEWDSNGHDGGGMAFGPDGCLYITAGDGTSGSDPDITGQDLTDLRASLLRIDVDHPDPGKPYGVPKDNPFLNVAGARPEIWAFGLRAPWRMSFDSANGDLWVGEVGQDLWEMIHLVKRGGNYGWSVMEGTHPFFPERKLGPAPVSPPIIEHHHSEARSITGGYVYRGKRLPALAGHYLYCCYQTGTVWSFRFVDGKVLDHRVLADSNYQSAGWGLDHAGELYMIALTGEILRLEPNPDAKSGESKFPRKLSETGVFASVREQTPAEGVLPYSVNAPVWHDGATMQRFLAVPGAGTVDPTTARGFEFQDGAVLAQTLSLEMKTGEPASRRKIETRLITRQGGEWFAYTYAWNDGEDEAALVPKEGAHRVFEIAGKQPGEKSKRTWRYDSRAECMVCHSRAANFVLGMNRVQLNREHDFGSVTDNQLRALQHADYFKPPLAETYASEPKLVDPYDTSADLELRVRSYLHTNCSQCHVADGGGNARMELELKTERDKMNVFGVTPLQGNFEIPGAQLIAPHDPYRSVLLYRISKLGGGRMPQVGSNVVDEAAVEMLRRWITSLPAKDEAPAIIAERKTLELDAAALAAKNPGEAIAAATKLLVTPSGGLRLLEAIDHGKIAGATSSQIVEAAAANPNANIRDLFERFLPEDRRIKRLGTSINVAALLARPGNVDRGRELFFNTSGVICQSCHQVNGKGKDVGPDLSHIAKKLGKPQLLENLIDPSKTMEEKYIAYALQTVDGRTATGLLIEKGPNFVAVKDAQSKILRVPMSEIDVLEPQKKSLMPEFLLRDLTADQAADLLAYLASLQ